VKLNKKILRSDFVQKVAILLAAAYIRLVYFTVRWQVIGADIPEKFINQGEPFILSFWHGRLLMMIALWKRRKPIHMLASSHRDGQLIVKTAGYFGVKAITGSSSRGGAGAARAMVKVMQQGDCSGITPDGPRGPRMRAQDGIVTIARLSGASIVPASYSIRRGKVLNSWDRFLVAAPFTTGVVIWGEPISVPRDADAQTCEDIRLAIENSLNDLTRKADRLCGREPIEPAPLISPSGETVQ